MYIYIYIDAAWTMPLVTADAAICSCSIHSTGRAFSNGWRAGQVLRIPQYPRYPRLGSILFQNLLLGYTQMIQFPFQIMLLYIQVLLLRRTYLMKHLYVHKLIQILIQRNMNGYNIINHQKIMLMLFPMMIIILNRKAKQHIS